MRRLRLGRSLTTKFYAVGRGGSSMPLEILHLALMLRSCIFRIERAEVATLARLRILLAGIQTILT